MSKRPKAQLMLPLLVAALLVLTVASCGESASQRPEGRTDAELPTTTSGSGTIASRPSAIPGVVFPTQEPPQREALMALAGGVLLIDKAGCVRLGRNSEDEDAYVPIWPPGYSLSAKDDRLRVLDGEGRFVARVGDEVEMSGGEREMDIEGVRIMPERLRRELPERCPGTYWIVGFEVRRATQ